MASPSILNDSLQSQMAEMEGLEAFVENLKQELEVKRREMDVLSRQLDELSSPRDVRLVVAGGFSAGKSAFINYLLESEVSREDVTPTTRSSTEYVYGKESIWRIDAPKRTLTREEYFKLSSKEGANDRFRFSLKSDFLKSGVVVIDTPGFGDNDDDADTARSAIRSADMIFWLVNVKDGTIKKTDLKELKESSNAAAVKKPIAIVMTWADALMSDRKSKAEDKAAAVRRQLTDLARENGLDLVAPPLLMSSKPERAKPSVQPIIGKQRQELEGLVAASREGLSAMRKIELEQTRKRVQKIEKSYAGKLDKAKAFLECRLKELGDAIVKSEKSIRRSCLKALEKTLVDHLESLADNLDSDDDAIKTHVYENGIVWDSYEAEFSPSLEFIDAAALSRKLAQTFRQHTDYKGAVLDCNDNIRALLSSVEKLVSPVVNDDWWGEAQSRARKELANDLSSSLRNVAWDGCKAFFHGFEMPKCNFRSDNLRTLHEELADAKCQLGVVESLASADILSKDRKKRKDQDQIVNRNPNRNGKMGFIRKSLLSLIAKWRKADGQQTTGRAR